MPINKVSSMNIAAKYGNHLAFKDKNVRRTIEKDYLYVQQAKRELLHSFEGYRKILSLCCANFKTLIQCCGNGNPLRNRRHDIYFLEIPIIILHLSRTHIRPLNRRKFATSHPTPIYACVCFRCVYSRPMPPAFKEDRLGYTGTLWRS